MRSGCTTDDARKRTWHECSLLCQFLSENIESVSQETELQITRRILLLVNSATGQGNAPDPF